MSELSSVGRTHSWVGLPVWAAAAGVWVLHGGAPAQFRHWSRGVVTVGVVRRCNSPGGAWGFTVGSSVLEYGPLGSVFAMDQGPSQGWQKRVPL